MSMAQKERSKKNMDEQLLLVQIECSTSNTAFYIHFRGGADCLTRVYTRRDCIQSHIYFCARHIEYKRTLARAQTLHIDGESHYRERERIGK